MNYRRLFPLFEQISAKQVAAMLRLGTKYDIVDLRTQALEILHYEYPTTLEDYDKSYDAPRLDYHDPTTSSRILNLALEFSLETVLPVAYLTQIRSEPLVCALFIQCAVSLSADPYRHLWLIMT